MSWLAPVPRDMAARKPAHGQPCNGCGVCCHISVCPLGQSVFGPRLGPCPAVQKNPDDPHKWECGLVVEPMRFVMHKCLAHTWQAMRAAASILIGTGDGCDCRINGEEADQKAYARWTEATRKNRDAIRAARRLFGI